MTKPNPDQAAIHTIRFLSADAIQRANSGHPGLPMGTASLAYVLWTRHLRFDPQVPSWADRDRFVLSAGHGSMLLYSLLHLSGFDLTLDDLKRFRQWESKTPGHPEYGHTPGVETTTGPLGQGFANGVGMAIAAHHLAARYNRSGTPLFNHRIFAIVSDGDLMEGIASEAASLAGHLRLGRLIYLYDDNRISIDGSTDLTFTEDRAARFRAYGWHVSHVEDVEDLEAVDRAVHDAAADPRPSLIVCRTHIGFGLPTRQDTAKAHGEPPGEEELRGAKESLGWPTEPDFLIPEEARQAFALAAARGRQAHEAWRKTWHAYREAYPAEAGEIERRLAGDLPPDLQAKLPDFPADAKGLATRASSGKVLNALAAVLPELIGGSADLTSSNQTALKGESPFSAENPEGRYFHFGVREHGMGGILSGMALHGGVIPFGGTFLVFSDYMRPSIRLAAMMGIRVIYVFSHDSIGLGEDGPTHQPVEHLAALRAIPNLVTLRPADAAETAIAWLVAVERKDGPTALALTRQAVPTLDRERFASAVGVRQGAYVLADLGHGDPQVILMASGSEVELICRAGAALAEGGIATRLVSFPSWELFERQPESVRNRVLPPGVSARVAVEAGVGQGWERWVGDHGEIVSLERFGASAPYTELFQNLGFTPERVIEVARRSLERAKGKNA
ncbi:MAG TPA: transketolase [Anaerolineales bacterium]|nr:transketolase [Anaerolineales bacterium]